MKRLSLQWRITLMSVLLIGITCVAMNLLLCSSGVYYMDTIADTAQVLSGMFEGIEYRGYGQAIVEELAKYASVPARSWPPPSSGAPPTMWPRSPSVWFPCPMTR